MPRSTEASPLIAVSRAEERSLRASRHPYGLDSLMPLVVVILDGGHGVNAGVVAAGEH